MGIIATNEFLVITDDKIIGTSCKIDKLNVGYIEFEINFHQVTDTIIQKREKNYGIDMSTFSILTANKTYEFVLLLGETEIRNIIEKSIKKNSQDIG